MDNDYIQGQISKFQEALLPIETGCESREVNVLIDNALLSASGDKKYSRRIALDYAFHAFRKAEHSETKAEIIEAIDHLIL